MNIVNLNYYFYIKTDIFDKEYPIISELDFSSYLLIHNGGFFNFKIIEYDYIMVERLIKLYKITKFKKLKKLNDFISFCNKNKMTIEQVLLEITNG